MIDMRAQSICRTCGKPTLKKHNAFYCVKCAKVWREQGAKRYKIGEDVFVWIRGNSVVRAVKDGKDVFPYLIGKEVVE